MGSGAIAVAAALLYCSTLAAVMMSPFFVGSTTATAVVIRVPDESYLSSLW